MHESDHDQKPSRKRKCRNEQRAHAHTISETRERISNNGRTRHTHTAPRGRGACNKRREQKLHLYQQQLLCQSPSVARQIGCVEPGAHWYLLVGCIRAASSLHHECLARTERLHDGLIGRVDGRVRV